jgi:hypothetical protein
MPSRVSVRFILASAALCTIAANSALSQNQRKPLTLVTWFGPGSITVPNDPDWKTELLTAYDNGKRPVVQLSNSRTLISVSYILFENLSGQPNAHGCRNDAINPILQNEGSAISQRQDGESKDSAGNPIATTSYMTAIGSTKAKQHSLFAFAGDAKICAEIHASTIAGTPDEDSNLKAVINGFTPNLTYQPNAMDYFVIASLLFKHSPELAAPYYKSSLDHLPIGPETLTPRRVITDQLVMSLGMSGDLKGSRAIAEHAIESDPDYPLNYYNLACADAEKVDANNARVHLQQAFDRKANTIPGEHLPDPTQDDSFIKLKKNKDFWVFVQTLR